jgi:hypothetical protein
MIFAVDHIIDLLKNPTIFEKIKESLNGSSLQDVVKPAPNIFGSLADMLEEVEKKMEDYFTYEKLIFSNTEDIKKIEEEIVEFNKRMECYFIKLGVLPQNHKLEDEERFRNNKMKLKESIRSILIAKYFIYRFDLIVF